MKRLLVTLFILAAAGAALFFLGWVQFRVPPGYWGVYASKTGGVWPVVVRPGAFFWRIEAVLPSNVSLYLFPAESYHAAVEINGELPSGRTYAAILPEQPDFSYDVALSMTLAVRPEELPRLVNEEALKPEGLEQWYAARADTIGERITTMIRQDPAGLVGDSVTLTARLRERLAREFGSLDILSLQVTRLRVPDARLYETARQAYMELAQRRYELEREALERSRTTVIEQEQYRRRQAESLELLERYGKLLAAYPVLLQFLYLNSLGKLGAIEPPTIPSVPSPELLGTDR